jgi:trehalose 6-phosphate synthase
VLVSNRGELEYRWDASGEPVAARGSGGVVTALSALTRLIPRSVWISCAMSEADRAAARAAPDAGAAGRQRARLLVPPPEEYRRYYGVFCNRFLWFLQHQMWDVLDPTGLAEALADSWENGYRPVNALFARAIVQEAIALGAAATREPAILVQDYHLYLAPGLVRARLPRARLQHFSHIPWPGPEAWTALPSPVVRALCESLLACDVAGFQNERSVAAFLETCAAYLPDAQIDRAARTVAYRGRRSCVRAYPITVDRSAVSRLAASPEAEAHRRRLAGHGADHLIVRVDRLDPSKNVARGLLAFEQLLAARAARGETGRVRLLACLVPTRGEVPEYRRCRAEAFELVERINRRFGAADWKPVEVLYENNYAQAIAAMSLADVLLVNPIADGMNLVAKEGALVNRRAGVLVLSRRAGAYEELGVGAIGIDPYDLPGTTDALERALAMPVAERRQRAAALRAAVSRNDVADWLGQQLADLRGLSVPPRWASAS